MRLLTPPSYDERLRSRDQIVQSTRLPTVIFLAGPIQGASDWQSQAYAYLTSFWRQDWSELLICSPRRSDSAWQYEFIQQVDWETHHLQLAAKCGTILFWLAKEHEHFCNRSYAQTTRFELGEWVSRAPESVVIGIEEGFTGERYIRHRLPKKQIHNTLEATCKAAIVACRGGVLE